MQDQGPTLYGHMAWPIGTAEHLKNWPPLETAGHEPTLFVFLKYLFFLPAGILHRGCDLRGIQGGHAWIWVWDMGSMYPQTPLQTPQCGEMRLACPD